MTTIRIMNADPSEFDDIQAIVKAHGFGILADDGHGGLVAMNPDNVHGKVIADMEKELIDDVGKHIAVSFK